MAELFHISWRMRPMFTLQSLQESRFLYFHTIADGTATLELFWPEPKEGSERACAVSVRRVSSPNSFAPNTLINGKRIIVLPA